MYLLYIYIDDDSYTEGLKLKIKYVMLFNGLRIFHFKNNPYYFARFFKIYIK